MRPLALGTLTFTMPRPRRNGFWRSLPRRLGTGLVLFAYLATVIGFPVAAAPPKKGGQPFPCQDHLCGCQSAEECWRHCCCFTPQERWAWARAHHVQPPPYAEKPGNPAPDPDEGVAEAHPAHSCCHHGDASSPCCGEPAKAGSCRHQAGRPAKPAARPARPAVPWGIGFLALKCKGLSTLWVSAGAVLPAPVLTWNPGLSPGDWLSDSAPALPGLSPCPPDPPPRLPGT